MNQVKALVRKAEVRQADGTPAQTADTRPLTVEEANWSYPEFFSVFPWMAFNIANWTTGSALLSLGLTVRQALAMAAIGEIIAASLMVSFGLIGSRWRIPEPYATRLSWGLSGYKIPILFTTCLTMLWYGIQGWFGALSLKVVISALIPGFATMRNTLGSAIATNDLICVAIFWSASLSFHWIHPTSFRHFGKFAAIGVLTSFIALTVVCLVKAKGAGPLLTDPYDLVGVSAPPKGANLAWAMVQTVSMVVSGLAPNSAPTITRYAKNRWAPVPAQLITVLLFTYSIILFGILSTSAAVEIFPEKPLLWAPYDLLLAFQENGSAGARAATFFAGLALVATQFGINVMVNGWNGGVRLSSLFPRWITVRRGAYLMACVGLAINPWRIAGRASGFNRFLGGLSIFISPPVGIVICDYFVVRRGRIVVGDLYVPRSQSIYGYRSGFNLRAIVACFMAIWPVLPGLIGAVSDGAVHIPGGLHRLYQLGQIWGLTSSGLIYYFLCWVFPLETKSSTGMISEVELPVEKLDSRSSADFDGQVLGAGRTFSEPTKLEEA